MKKISTVAAKQSSNLSQPKLTIGLDLGDRSSWYCVLDERGEVQWEGKVSTTAKAMREVFGRMPRSRIALETGTHSPWVSRLLSGLGHEVIVAHARNVRLMTVSVRPGSAFRASLPSPLFDSHMSGDAEWGYDVSPDGREFVVTVAPEAARVAPIKIVLNWAALTGR